MAYYLIWGLGEAPDGPFIFYLYSQYPCAVQFRNLTTLEVLTAHLFHPTSSIQQLKATSRSENSKYKKSKQHIKGMLIYSNFSLLKKIYVSIVWGHCFKKSHLDCYLFLVIKLCWSLFMLRSLFPKKTTVNSPIWFYEPTT